MTTDTEALVEKLARAMVLASRPGANPDKLQPATRGKTGSVPLWQLYAHMAEGCLPIIEAERTRYGKERWNAGVEAAVGTLEPWLRTDALKLACGEMPAQEVRTVRSVLQSRIVAARSLREPE